MNPRDGVFIRSFRPEDEEQVRTQILQGLGERWGRIDESQNPNLPDITATYDNAVFLTAWLAGELVGTGALIRESPGVGRIVRMSVDSACRSQASARRSLNICSKPRRTTGTNASFWKRRKPRQMQSPFTSDTDSGESARATATCISHSESLRKVVYAASRYLNGG